MFYYYVTHKREIIAGPYLTPGEAFDAERAARVVIDRRHFYGPFDILTIARSLDRLDAPYNFSDLFRSLDI